MTENKFCELHKFITACEMTGYINKETLESFREIMRFFVQRGGVLPDPEGDKPVKPLESITTSMPVKRARPRRTGD